MSSIGFLFLCRALADAEQRINQNRTTQIFVLFDGFLFSPPFINQSSSDLAAGPCLAADTSWRPPSRDPGLFVDPSAA